MRSSWTAFATILAVACKDQTRRCKLFELSTLLLWLVSACGGGGANAGATQPPVTQPPVTLPAGWTKLADMPAGVAKFGVAAVAGKIVVAGGYDTQRGVMVYDISTNSWSTGAALPRGSDNLAAVTAGNNVYAIGGEAGTAVQVYDLISAAWTAGPALPGVRFASAAAVLGNRVHVVGGWNANNAASASFASQVVFDLATQAWSSGASLTTARNAAGAAVIDDRLYVVGGRSPGIRANDQQRLASVEVYTAAANSWAAGVPLLAARASLAVVALDGRLYALGGETTAGTVSDAVERFDPATQAWAALPVMPYKVHGLGAVVVGTSIYVMGGFTWASDALGTESAALYRYTPTS